MDIELAQALKEIADLKAQIEKLKSVVISERDEALRVEDVITYSVLNDIIDKLEIKENEKYLYRLFRFYKHTLCFQ